MPNIPVIVSANLQHTPLDTPSLQANTLAGRPVLHWTIHRARQIANARRILVVHPENQPVDQILDASDLSDHSDLKLHPYQTTDDPYRPSRVAARKWSANHWRGGFAGSCVFDELLPASPLLEALNALRSDSALIIGGDWCMVDPALCDLVIERHLDHTQSHGMTFTQAPPGLCGFVIHRSLLEKLVEEPAASIGSTITFRPSVARGDPIGTDVCVPIPPQVRNRPERWVYDSPLACDRIERLIRMQPQHWFDLSAVDALACVPPRHEQNPTPPPTFVTLEITTRRTLRGQPAGLYQSTTPEALELLEQKPINASPDRLRQLLADLAEWPETTVLLGGRGDPLLHPEWGKIVSLAQDAGIGRLGLETDLLDLPEDAIAKLLACNLDFIAPRLISDTAETYAKVTGLDRFAEAIGNIEALINGRAAAATGGQLPIGVPWIIPRAIRSRENLPDLESFFDRWTHFLGHAVIDPAPVAFEDGDQHGWDTVEHAGLIHVNPPLSVRQAWVTDRLTIHADLSLPTWNPTGVSEQALSLASFSLQEAWQRVVRKRLDLLGTAGSAVAGAA